jgi:hypothetical protein
MNIEELRSPRARNTDPVTSHAAANAVDFAGAHYTAIYEALLLAGPSGKDRIAHWANLDRSQVARRLEEMRRLGLVVLTGELVMSRSNRSEREWQAVEKKEQA